MFELVWYKVDRFSERHHQVGGSVWVACYNSRLFKILYTLSGYSAYELTGTFKTYNHDTLEEAKQQIVNLITYQLGD